MPKTLLSIVIAATLLLISACQSKSDERDSSVEPAASIKEQHTELLPKVAASKKADAALNSAVDAQTCLDLNKAMQKIGDTSKIEAIYEAQNQLKACLPTASNKEVLKLLENYQAMYGRFLASDNYMDGEVYFDISESLENERKVSPKQLSSIGSRNQYLINLIEKDADVSLLYIGEGIFVFHHDLKAMADLFAPYLTKDQKAFTQRMAIDNQDIFWNDAAVAVPFEEVIDRALFWENYIRQYPDSYFIKDAKKLFKLYRRVLFFGSDNTNWMDDLYREFYDPAYEQMMRKLSHRPNSVLARDAKKLLTFMSMSEVERRQNFPTDTQIESDGDNEWAAWSLASEQLNLALPIPSPWSDNSEGYRDCLSSVLCVEHDY